MIDSPLQDVARKHGVSYDIMRGLPDCYVTAKVDWKKIKQICDIGIADSDL